MKWILIILSMSISTDPCDRPSALLKHADELYDTKAECESAFKGSSFYKSKVQEEIVGFCMQISPMMISPKQSAEKIEYPRCR